MADRELTHMPEMKVGMLIRRPPVEVFEAFVDPAVATKFWFTRSTGPLTTGALIQWEWEMYGVSTKVAVKEVTEGRRIRFDWNDEQPTAVELRFLPRGQDDTFVEVVESGFHGNGDDVAARVAASSSGFSIVLCAAKALLEHGISLRAVDDRHPDLTPTEELPPNESAAALHRTVINSWNAGDSDAFAAAFAPTGVVVGFDGTTIEGRDAIRAHLHRVFGDHRTASYVAIVRDVRAIGPDLAILRADVGMVPPDGDDINPDTNAVQHLVASRGRDRRWRIELFQNTPAAFHGRPADANALTTELRRHIPSG